MRIDNRVRRDRMTMWEGGSNFCRVIKKGFPEETAKDKKKTGLQEEETGCEKALQREGALN